MANAYKILPLNAISAKGLARLPQSYSVGGDLAEPDAILVRSHNMHDMDIPVSVRAIGRAGAGTNNIPVKLMSERGVPVFNAPGANANAVKELVLAGMLIAAPSNIANSGSPCPASSRHCKMTADGGGRSASPVLTCRASAVRRQNQTSPYTIYNETSEDGKPVYYLKDTASIATYGLIQRVIYLPQQVQVEASSLGALNAANALYDWGAVSLGRKKDPQRIYRCTIRKVDKELLPGDRVRLDYVGKVYQQHVLVDYADIHEVLWVLGIQEQIGEGGRTLALDISNVDVNPLEMESMLADVANRSDEIRVQL